MVSVWYASGAVARNRTTALSYANAMVSSSNTGERDHFVIFHGYIR